MLYTKPTHQFVPTVLVGQVVRSLWPTCICYADLYKEHMLDTISTGCIFINLDTTFRMCHFYKGKQHIYIYMKRFWVTGSVLDREHRRHAKVQVDELGARLETFPWERFVWLAQQMGVSASSLWNTTELLYLHLCKTDVFSWNSVTQIVKQTWILRRWFQGVYAGEVDPTLVLSSYKACFHLRGYIPLRKWVLVCMKSYVNLWMPLHVIKYLVWCAISATGIVGPIFVRL
jgi:hypothetical protein